MYGGKRRKKPRPMHCIKTVEVTRGKNGFGFTVSGDAPCILSCIVNGSPADRAGLRTGDFIMNVNGLPVANASHDEVVRLIGSSHGVLVLSIAENGRNSSDSSDTEAHEFHHATRPKSKYHTRRGHRSGSARREEVEGRRQDPVGSRYGGGVARDLMGTVSKVPRGISPTNREVEAYFQNHEAHHHRHSRSTGVGIENIDPYNEEPYRQRRPKQGSMENLKQSHVPHRQTKHTIITREHRLGLTKSANLSDSFGVRHLLPNTQPLNLQANAINLSTASSSSASTYIPMTGGRVTQSQREVHHHDADIDIDDIVADIDAVANLDNLRVVVGYVGSVEMPREARLAAQRPHSIRNAVKRLQVERKRYTLVLMVITVEGVTLVNTLGTTVAVYHADKVAHSGVNSDDKRFFGIMTSQCEAEVGDDGGSSLFGGSCHVFMVDPDLSVHSEHAGKAKMFGIQCTTQTGSGRCLEFPKSATVIVTCISRLYLAGRSANAIEGGLAAHLSDFSQPIFPTAQPQRHAGMNSSNSDSGLGLSKSESAPASKNMNAPVCVVEMPHNVSKPADNSVGLSQRIAPNDSDSNNSSTLRNSTADNSESSLPWAASGDSLKLAGSATLSFNQSLQSNIVSAGNNSSISNLGNISGVSSFLNESRAGKFGSTPALFSEKESNGTEDKFTLRAMPNPKSFPGKSDSWKSLLDDQNSAENLRRSMQKYLSKTGANESHSDVESVHSLDLGFESQSAAKVRESEESMETGNSPQSMEVDDSPPAPPLPPRTMRGYGSGSSLGSFPGSNLGALQPLHGKSAFQHSSSSRVPNPYAQKGPLQIHSKANVGRSEQVSGPMKAMHAVDKEKMPPPKTIPNANKPPLAPSALRTPQQRPQAERPKSTPPIRPRPGSEIEMDVDYDSDPAELSSFADTFDVTKEASRIRSEIRREQAEIDKAGQHTQRSQHYRAATDDSVLPPALNDQKQQSLAVNNNTGGAEGVGARLGEQATGITVITSNGVLSYQQNGSAGVAIGRAAGWAVNFDRLLRDKVGLANFTEFLKKEFSEENIVFWNACEKYSKTKDLGERKEMALAIHKNHIAPNASQAVNIDGTCMSLLTEEALLQAKQDLYDTARKQIFQLMKTDSYPRFIKSDLYKNCVTCELDGKPIPNDDSVSMTSQQSDTISTGSRESIGKKSKYAKKAGEDGSGNEKRRRSFLPWGKNKHKLQTKHSDSDLVASRKNGSFGKKTADPQSLNQLKNMANGEVHSKDDNDVCGDQEQNQKFLRVALPDGSTTVIYAKPSTTVRAAITKLCERRNLDVNMVDVYSSTTEKILDLSRDVSKLGTKEIVLEPRIVFRLDLPHKKCLAIKAPGLRGVRSTVSDVIPRYGFTIEGYLLQEVGSNCALDSDAQVKDVQHKRIALQPIVHTNSDARVPQLTIPHSKSEPAFHSQSATNTLSDDSMDQVFQELFNGDAQLHARFDCDGVLDFEKKDEKQTKEDNRLSGIFTNLLRKNSMDGKEGSKKAKQRGGTTLRGQKPSPEPRISIPQRVRSENEDVKVFALLSKVSSQFDDQRGLLRKEDLELPDFLKPKPANGNASDKTRLSYHEGSPLRKAEMHSSDTSLYEANVEARDNLEQMRTLSNSEECMDNLLMKQFRGSSRNKSGYSIHSAYSSAMGRAPIASTESSDCSPSKFPYMDASFTSADGVMPSHGDAEQLFHDSVHQAKSPDFNRSGLMEKSRVDFGDGLERNGEIKHYKQSVESRSRTSQSGAVKSDKSNSVYRELISSSGSIESNAGSNSTTKYNRRQRPQKNGSDAPIPAPRRTQSTKHSRNLYLDSDSVSSDPSSTSQSGHNSTNSSDLDHTLLPPSDDSDTSSVQSSESRNHPASSALPTTPKGVLQLDPSRQTYFPAPSRPGVKNTKQMTSQQISSPNSYSQRTPSLKEQSISWVMQQQSRTSIHPRSPPPQSPLPHASYRANASGSELNTNKGPTSPRLSRSSTPSPTTHDLILAPESSSDEAPQQSSPQAPVPARRISINRNQTGGNTSLENVIERGNTAQRLHKQKQKSLQLQSKSENEDDVQVSYV